MQKTLTYTYALLLVLTLMGALLSSFSISKTMVLAIVAFSIAKFLTVAFQFMELKNAHSFWKVLIVLYGFLIGGVFITMLY